MRILLTGGGSGGHFYPLIAVAEEIRRIVKEEKLIEAELYYMSDTPYDESALFDNEIEYRKVVAGKIRRYFSLENAVDIFKTAYGCVKALFTLFGIFPDVIFSKGGYASIPVIFSAVILRIPIIIHESDSSPGLANRIAAKFATKIAVSYKEAASEFPKEKVAWTGNPIRKGILNPVKEGANELLSFDPKIPTILVLGGSLGAQVINENIVDALPTLLKKYQVIHQAGAGNERVVSETSAIVLKNSNLSGRYKVVGYLDDEAMRMAVGASAFIISRAGSAIFEIAAWGIASLIIPITESQGDHQRRNAQIYAKSGAAIVVEEANLAPHILVSEISRVLDNIAVLKKMSVAAKNFSKPDAAEKIARAVISIGLSHEG